MLGCSLREDGAHVFHNEEEIAIFRFDNDWDLLTIEVDGVEYSLDGGHEADDQIQGWMETDPGYDYSTYGSTGVIVSETGDDWGYRMGIGIIDIYHQWPSRIIAEVTELLEEGRVEIAVFQRGIEQPDIFEF